MEDVQEAVKSWKAKDCSIGWIFSKLYESHKGELFNISGKKTF
jgi:hypothetical protein